jgi:hypothetical protein
MEDIFDVRVLNCHLMTYSVHGSTLFIMKQMPPITIIYNKINIYTNSKNKKYRLNKFE